jgi:hypothetical protein
MAHDDAAVEPPKPNELDSVIGMRPRRPGDEFEVAVPSRSTICITGISPRAIASAQTTPSTAPAAAIRWPIVLLVELTCTRAVSSPNTARTAALSLRSFIGVDVPWALM